MKIFISQPMGGKTDEEINAARQEAIADIRSIFGGKSNIEILDTNFNFPGKGPLYYLAESLKYLETADLAFFMKDWDKYRGCRIEHQCCIEYGIPYLHQDLPFQ